MHSSVGPTLPHPPPTMHHRCVMLHLHNIASARPSSLSLSVLAIHPGAQAPLLIRRVDGVPEEKVSAATVAVQGLRVRRGGDHQVQPDYGCAKKKKKRGGGGNTSAEENPSRRIPAQHFFPPPPPPQSILVSPFFPISSLFCSIPASSLLVGIDLLDFSPT